jgi:hypothetical protein
MRRVGGGPGQEATRSGNGIISFFSLRNGSSLQGKRRSLHRFRCMASTTLIETHGAGTDSGGDAHT